jgi:O-antigen ligase
MRSNMLLAILPVLALLSVTWSVAPKVTLSSSVGLIAASIFGAYFGLRFTFLQQLNMLAKALALIAVASLLIVILMPSYGISHGIHLGDWRGAFGQKNRLGMFMSIGTLVFWSLLRARPSERRPRIIIGLITCAFLLVMSGSKTGVIVLILLSSLLACRRVLTWRTKSVVMLMGMTGLLLVLGARVFVQNAPVLFKLLGRDPTLSGRLGLWVAVAFKIAQRPWLGYGFQSFWQGPYGESRSIWALLGWTVPYAHNGFLDLLLDLGLVGLVAFLVGYVLALIRARKYLLFSPMPPEAVWPLAFLLFTFLYNLTETCLIGRNGIFWVLLVATVARLSMTQPGRIVGT